MLSLRERREEESKREWADTLKEEGFANDAALEGAIKKLENDLKKARKKEANEEDVEVSTLECWRALPFSWHSRKGPHHTLWSMFRMRR